MFHNSIKGILSNKKGVSHLLEVGATLGLVAIIIAAVLPGTASAIQDIWDNISTNMAQYASNTAQPSDTPEEPPAPVEPPEEPPPPEELPEPPEEPPPPVEPPPEEPVNVILSHSFEDGLDGWILNEELFCCDWEDTPFGNYTIYGVVPLNANHYGYYAVDVQPNTTYTASCYGKYGSKNDYPYFSVVQFNSAGKEIKSNKVGVPYGTMDWHRMVITFTTLSDAVKIELRLVLPSGYSGNCYYDAVQLEIGDQATPFQG